MAFNKDKFFNGDSGLNNSAKWSFNAVIDRTNQLPLDKFSVFTSYAAASAYAESNPIAYPGQLIAVIPDDNDTEANVTGYVIQTDGTLKELITTVVVTGTGNAVTSITKDEDTIYVNKENTFLTSETQLSKGTDTTTTKTLTHGGTFTAVTDTTVSGHQITDTTTTYTLPSETVLSVDQLTGSATVLTHGDKVTLVSAVAKGDSSHNVDVTKIEYTLPSETSLSKGTDSTASKTLTHGGTFTAVTDTTVSGHKITDTTTTYTLPSETQLSKGTDSADTAVTLKHGDSFTVMTDTSVSGHTITDKTTTFTLPTLPGVSDTDFPVIPINKGGTNATTAAQALINLGLTATAKELNYSTGLTSNIQQQFNAIEAIPNADIIALFNK